MTPPTPAETAARFADLLDLPYDPAADPDVLMVAMIAEAKAGGLTWAQIGSVTIGRRDPKAAKKHAKALARAANTKAASVLGSEAGRE